MMSLDTDAGRLMIARASAAATLFGEIYTARLFEREVGLPQKNDRPA